MQQLLHLVIYDFEAFYILERFLGRLHSVIIAAFGGSILIPRHSDLDSSIYPCSLIRQRLNEPVFSYYVLTICAQFCWFNSQHVLIK